MLKPTIPTVGWPNFLRPHIASRIGTGILTCFPVTIYCAGTLGLSTTVFLTLFVATHVSILTSDTSSMPHGTPSQAYRTLRYHALTYECIRSFGAWL